MQDIERASGAVRNAASAGGAPNAFVPAMYGCVDCRTAWFVTAPSQPGACPDCGARMAMLSRDQIQSALTARPMAF